MKLKLVKVAAAASIAAAAIFAPMAANAEPYAPTPPAENVTVGPGGTVTVPFTGFAPNETVSFTLTGENASAATLAFVHFAVETANLGTKQANADGAVSAAVTLPADASGTYVLTAVGADGSASADIVVTAGPGTGLAVTGADSAQLLGLWIGGGALLLAGGGIAVAATVRRHRAEAAA